MARDDQVHSSGITVNEYADWSLDPQTLHLHSDIAWAILWGGVLIGRTH